MNLFPGLELPVLYYPPEDSNNKTLKSLGLLSDEIEEEDLVQHICTFYTIHQVAPRHAYDEDGNPKYPNHSVLQYGHDDCIIPMSPEDLNNKILNHVLNSLNSQSLNSEEDEG